MPKNAIGPILFALLILLLCGEIGSAEQRGTVASGFIRTDFTVENGLPDNVINAIVQTNNGLLWVATQAGLATFDGRGFHPVHPHSSGARPLGAAHALCVSARGDLWVGTDSGLVIIPKEGLGDPDGSTASFYAFGDAKSDEVEVIVQTRDGIIWVGTDHGLYRFDGGAFSRVLSGPYISHLSEAANGKLLVVTSNSLLELDGGVLTDHPEVAKRLGVASNELFDVYVDRTGTTWYNTKTGVRRQRGNDITKLAPEEFGRVPSERMYEDNEGNIWVSTGIDVYKVVEDHLESTGVEYSGRCIFVSRDGVLWVGTNGNGLIRLRRRVVRMFTKADGLPRDIVMALLPSRDGRLWIGSNCGLSVFDGKTFTNYNKPDGLMNTCVWTMAEDSNNRLWIGTYGGGLFSFSEGHFTQYSTKEGLISDTVLHIELARDNSLWIATPDGVSHLSEGKFRNYTTADGLSSNRTLSVHEDHNHVVWVATQSGVDRLEGDRFSSFAATTSANDHLVNNFAEDSTGNMYALNATNGASLVSGRSLQSIGAEMNLIGMTETASHDLWFSGRNGVFAFDRDTLAQRGPTGDALDFNLIDRNDGLFSTQCSVGFPNIVITSDRKLWVATVKGLAMVDLTDWPGRSRKPEVFLQSIMVDGRQISLADETVLPKGNHRVEFHVSAVDLASPEKIRLQYRMEGLDTRWNDDDGTGTAVYTNIPPGRHTFQVRATDSNGTWDRIGERYKIAQTPFLYQTKAFLLLCLCLIVIVLSIAYLVRVRHLIHYTRTLLEERLSERERIARDLHDTFFQGIQGLLLRFNTGTAMLPHDEPARQIFTEALEQSDRVMLEGRELVLDLHTSESTDLDLEGLAHVGDHVTNPQKPLCEVVVVGRTQPLQTGCAIELNRLAREAILNAYQHAEAQTIEVEVEYRRDAFKLRVRDDGRGIDESFLREGARPGHLGLPGMRERAARMGATFTLWSKKGNGTEIEVTIPAEKAYPSPGKAKGAGYLLKRFRRLLDG